MGKNNLEFYYFKENEGGERVVGVYKFVGVRSKVLKVGFNYGGRGKEFLGLEVR